MCVIVIVLVGRRDHRSAPFTLTTPLPPYPLVPLSLCPLVPVHSSSTY